MKNIKVYCLVCLEHILDTTDKFKPGVEYDGSMFKMIDGAPSFGVPFQFHDGTTMGNLHCPRDGQHEFIRPDGVVLTEHGLVSPGQKSIDREFFVVHREGELKGLLMSDSTFSKEVEEYKATVFEEGEIVDEPFLDDLNIEKPAKQKKLPHCKKCGKEIPYGNAHSKGCE